MAENSDYVDVTVNLGTRPLSTAAFNDVLYLATHQNFLPRVQIYTTLDSLVLAGFGQESNTYKYAARVFAGGAAPNRIYVGRRALDELTLTPTAQNDADYTFTIQVGSEASVDISFTSDASATVAEITAGIEAALTTASITGLTSTDNNTHNTLEVGANNVLQITALSSNIVLTTSSTESIADAMAAVTQERDDWFFLGCDSVVDADVLALGAYAEANDKMYATATSDSDVWTVGTGDIASQLRALQYDNSIHFAHTQAESVQASGGVIGAMATTNPGTTILGFKTFGGVPFDNFTPTQEQIIKDKNSNFYTDVAGAGIFDIGRMASGQRFDTIRFSLWFKSRVAEAVFGLLKRKSDLNQKVSYDSTGYGQIRQAIKEVIDIGINRGAISEDIGREFSITFPTTVSDNDRANRHLPDVNVTVYYTNAIETVRINAFILL